MKNSFMYIVYASDTIIGVHTSLENAAASIGIFPSTLESVYPPANASQKWVEPKTPYSIREYKVGVNLEGGE
tara:strand:+ start:4580 stop:4795 length:216 start_codon:yes stop_codon:yes gene_type:complete